MGATWPTYQRTLRMHKIDRAQLEQNYKDMINLLEYDSMRSPGKAKLNCQPLYALYNLLDRLEKAPAKPTKKKEA